MKNTGILTFFVTLMLFLAYSPETSAQKRMVVYGQVMDAETSHPASGVHVRSTDRNVRTDVRGWFEIPIKPGSSLTVNDVKYHSRTLPYNKRSFQDTLKIYMTLNTNLHRNVTGSNVLETVHASTFEHVLDCAFASDTLVVLAYMRSKPSTTTMPTRYLHNTLTFYKYGEQVERVTLPDYVYGLYQDPFGRLFVLGHDFYLHVERSPKGARAVEISEEYFDTQVKSLTTYRSKSLFFKKQFSILPEVTHYVIHGETDEVKPIRKIVNEKYFNDVAGDFRMLYPPQLKEADKLSEEHGVDRELFAPLLRQFQTGENYTYPYAPAFSSEEHLFIFDHLHNWIFKHDLSGHALDSVSMYHHLFSDEKYHGPIQDFHSGKCYAVHEKSGSFFLRQITPETAAVGKPFKIRYGHPGNIRVFHDWVYYTYRDPSSHESRKLVREKLPDPDLAGN